MPICVFCGNYLDCSIEEHMKSSKWCHYLFSRIYTNLQLSMQLLNPLTTYMYFLTTPNDGFLGGTDCENEPVVSVSQYMHYKKGKSPSAMMMNLAFPKLTMEFCEMSPNLYEYEKPDLLLHDFRFMDVFSKINTENGLIITEFKIDFFGVQENINFGTKYGKVPIKDPVVSYPAQNPPGGLTERTMKALRNWQ